MLFNFNDKVCSRGSSLYLINSNAIFQALSRSYVQWSRVKRETCGMTQEFQFRQYLVLLNLNDYYMQAVLSLRARRLKAYQALNSVFWQAIQLLIQSLNSSSKSRQRSCDNWVFSAHIIHVRSDHLCMESVWFKLSCYTVASSLLVQYIPHKCNKEFTWFSFKNGSIA